MSKIGKRLPQLGEENQVRRTDGLPWPYSGESVRPLVAFPPVYVTPKYSIVDRLEELDHQREKRLRAFLVICIYMIVSGVGLALVVFGSIYG